MVRHSRMMWLIVAIAIPLLLTAGGCDNKIKAQNDALNKQNKDLQAQIDADKADADAKNAEIERLRAAAIAAQTPTTQSATPDMGAALDAPAAGGTTASDASMGITYSKTKAGEKELEVASDVLFDSGKSSLKPAAKRALERVVAILKSEYAGKSFRIEGHTDNVPFKKGSKMDNQKLGLARANSVEKFLISKGISAHHLTTISYGASEPKSKTNLALNRRVDIVVEQ